MKKTNTMTGRGEAHEVKIKKKQLNIINKRFINPKKQNQETRAKESEMRRMVVHCPCVWCIGLPFYLHLFQLWTDISNCFFCWSSLLCVFVALFSVSVCFSLSCSLSLSLCLQPLLSLDVSLSLSISFSLSLFLSSFSLFCFSLLFLSSVSLFCFSLLFLSSVSLFSYLSSSSPLSFLSFCPWSLINLSSYGCSQREGTFRYTVAFLFEAKWKAARLQYSEATSYVSDDTLGCINPQNIAC